MIEKLTLRLIDYCYRVRTSILLNDELLKTNSDDVFLFNEEEYRVFYLNIEKGSIEICNKKSMVFEYNFKEESFTFTDCYFKAAILNDMNNIMLRAQDHFKSKKITKRKLTF